MFLQSNATSMRTSFVLVFSFFMLQMYVYVHMNGVQRTAGEVCFLVDLRDQTESPDFSQVQLPAESSHWPRLCHFVSVLLLKI